MKHVIPALLLTASCAFGGYNYNRSITLDHTKSGSANLANFTVLISGTYSYLATTANSGRVQNTVTCGVNSITCPADLIYTSDSGCTTLLNWEVESYTASSGAIVAWVKVASVTFATDAVIYECYGNAAVTTFLGGAAGTAWDTNTKLIYHFGAGPSNKDSSSNANHLVFANSPTSVTGLIGSGGGFTPATIFTGPTGTSTTTVANTTNSTVSGWVYLISLLTEDVQPVNFFGTFAGYPYYQISPAMYNDGTSVGKIYNDTPSYSPASAALTTGVWHHLAVTYNGSQIIYYVDGVSTGTTSRTTTLSTATFYVNALDRRINANYDEIKLATINRPASWILAEKNNQSSPATFYTVGSEQSSGSTSQAIVF